MVILLRPCKLIVWHGFLSWRRGTVVGIEHVEYVEIGIVDGGGGAVEAHFICGGVSFGVVGGFRDLMEGIDEGAFS